MITTGLHWGCRQSPRATVTMEIKFFCHLAVITELSAQNGQILVLCEVAVFTAMSMKMTQSSLI
jgi:hypothetical protein